MEPPWLVRARAVEAGIGAAALATRRGPETALWYGPFRLWPASTPAAGPDMLDIWMCSVFGDDNPLTAGGLLLRAMAAAGGGVRVRALAWQRLASEGGRPVFLAGAAVRPDLPMDALLERLAACAPPLRDLSGDRSSLHAVAHARRDGAALSFDHMGGDGLWALAADLARGLFPPGLRWLEPD